jgi:nucleotide-binding universal stress UspA family protein
MLSPITRILVPTDFSADADTALAYALDIASRFQATVHLLHVVDDPLASGVWSTEVSTAEIAGLQATLVRDAEQRLRELVPDQGTVSTEVRTGHAAAQILEVARERNNDLIVMGTHGRTGLAHLLMGSIAERVVRLAPCPVLTMRAAGVPQAVATVA